MTEIILGISMFTGVILILVFVILFAHFKKLNILLGVFGVKYEISFHCFSRSHHSHSMDHIASQSGFS